MIAKVAVENTAFSFDDAFDYAIPEKLSKDVRPGVRVLVPFGRGRKKRQGVVFALREKSKDAVKLKNIAAVLDPSPLLNNEMLRLAVFMKDEYFCTLYEAVKAMLPTGLGLNLVTSYIVNPDVTDDMLTSLSPDEKSVFSFLSDKSVYVRGDRLLKELGFKQDFPIAEKMADKGFLIRNIDSVRRIGDATVKMVKLSEFYYALREPPKFTAKQKQVVKFLTDTGSASVKEVCYFTGVTTAVVTTLERKGILEFFDNEVFRRPKFLHGANKENIVLTSEQSAAFKDLCGRFQSDKAETSLLFGVTGSGKTKVYMRLIDEVLKTGKGCIVMVPEISLTPQLLSLFYNRYGEKVAVFHSALSMGERLDEWKRVKNGEAKIALGTRSAVFAPFDNLGLVIMDEEQEGTYKSEMSPRYHAKDVAAFRVGCHNGLLLLASATPSLTTYAAAKSGIYSLNVLKNRYGNAVLPEVITTEMKYGADPTKTKNLSDELTLSLKETLENKKQAILLLNRRGYNTFAACESCGKVMTCPNCSISLTYHSKNGRLMCHYCGYSEPFTNVCRECGEKSVVFSGTGTQRLEEELHDSFPEARVLRLDADTTTSRYSFENSLKKFTNGEYDIMLGTQMVAKGLDFPNVTLVGIISIDQQLYNDDYKSAERTFDLLTQVIGRAGRGDSKGRAVIQTSFPENEIIRLAEKQDFEAFYNLEISMRKAMIYPPYCNLCVVSFTGSDEMLTKSASKVFLNMLKERQKNDFADLSIIVLGPIAPRISKISGKYRFRIIIKCKNTKKFRFFLSGLLKDYAKDGRFSAVTAFADIDPESIL